MKVLIVDDHTLVRRGLAYVVENCVEEAEIEEAAGADEAVEVLKEKPIDIALVDVRMPGRDGLELLKEMKATWPAIPVIMLTSYDHSRYVKMALTEGAAGYMLKDATPDDLSQSIQVAMSGGGNVLSARAIRNLFEDDGEQSDEAFGGGRRIDSSLTPRELDIMALLAEGKSNREIARSIYLSEKTVKAHLAAVFRKLGVSNRTQAAMAAVSMGIGPRDPDSDAEAFEDQGPRAGARRP